MYSRTLYISIQEIQFECVLFNMKEEEGRSKQSTMRLSQSILDSLRSLNFQVKDQAGLYIHYSIHYD